MKLTALLCFFGEVDLSIVMIDFKPKVTKNFFIPQMAIPLGK